MINLADEEQLEYLAMLLDAGVDPTEAEESAMRAVCSWCGRQTFAGALDASKRCIDCQP